MHPRHAFSPPAIKVFIPKVLPLGIIMVFRKQNLKSENWNLKSQIRERGRPINKCNHFLPVLDVSLAGLYCRFRRFISASASASGGIIVIIYFKSLACKGDRLLPAFFSSFFPPTSVLYIYLYIYIFVMQLRSEMLWVPADCLPIVSDFQTPAQARHLLLSRFLGGPSLSLSRPLGGLPFWPARNQCQVEISPRDICPEPEYGSISPGHSGPKTRNNRF